MAKKTAVKVSKDEFLAYLLRNAYQDAEQWVDGLQVFLNSEEVAFIEKLRQSNANHAATAAASLPVPQVQR